MLHVVGNSHAYFFTGQDEVRGFDWLELKPVDTIDNIRTYSIGPATAYQFYDKYWKSIYLLNIPDHSKIMLTLGEVDCRFQIPNRHRTLRDCLDSIDVTIKRFIAGVGQLIGKYEMSVWGVHPPSRNTPEPSVGSCAFRTTLVRYWNERMKSECKDSGLLFFSIFDELLEYDGLVNMKYMLDNIHLRQTAMPHALKALNGYQNT